MEEQAEAMVRRLAYYWNAQRLFAISHLFVFHNIPNRWDILGFL